MKKPEWRMMNKSGIGKLRWLSAVCEACLMLWFLMICWFVLGVSLRHPEVLAGVNISDGAKPEITKLALALLPQHSISILLGLPGLAIGFAAMAMVTDEALSSRLFRWLVVLIATFVFAAFLPLADRVLTLGREIDTATFDWTEALVTLAGVSAAFSGVWHARRRMK